MKNNQIHQQVRDILNLILNNNVKQAEETPAVRLSIAQYGEPLSASADRIVAHGKRITLRTERLFDADFQRNHNAQSLITIEELI